MSLKSEIEKLKEQALRDSLSLILSSIIVRVSNQESNTRYAAVEKNTDAKDVFRHFNNAVLRMAQILEKQRNTDTQVQIVNKDVLCVSPTDLNWPVGLVITSPPYPNAYEYWLYHKYRMCWLGYDPFEVRKKEIGSRHHFFRKNHHTADDFRKQMGFLFGLLSNTVVSDGFVCFIIGDSKIHGKIVNNSEIIKKVAEQTGFCLETSLERHLAQTKKSFNMTYSRAKCEKILIFKNKGIMCRKQHA